MAEYTTAEITQQAVKGMRYFGRALREQKRGFFAIRQDELDGMEPVVLLVARGEMAERLRKAVDEGELLGSTAAVELVAAMFLHE